MRLCNRVSGALLGASMLLLSNASQALVVSAAADFDLSSLNVTSTGGIASVTPIFYTAFAELPTSTANADDFAPVSSTLDSLFSTGGALVVSDAAHLDPNTLSVSATAFDEGFGLGTAAMEILYEVIGDGDVTVSIDYSAFYDLDSSATGDILISLLLDDSLSGTMDGFDLLPGDPELAFGTLSLEFSARAGDVGSLFLSAAAAADTGLALGPVITSVPAPGALPLIGAGFIALFGMRARAD